MTSNRDTTARSDTLDEISEFSSVTARLCDDTYGS